MMDNMLDCDFVVTKFKLQSYYCIHFQSNILWRGMTLQTMVLIVALTLFKKDDFDIK